MRILRERSGRLMVLPPFYTVGNGGQGQRTVVATIFPTTSTCFLLLRPHSPLSVFSHLLGHFPLHRTPLNMLLFFEGSRHTQMALILLIVFALESTGTILLSSMESVGALDLLPAITSYN